MDLTDESPAWKAFTDPAHLIHWWGPNGFTNTFKEIAIRPGGIWKFVMHGPDGRDYNNLIIFREINEPERIVYDHGEKEDDPGFFRSTVTFEERDGKTTVTLRAVFKTAKDRDYVVQEYGAIEGGKQTLGRLEEYVLKM